MDASKRIERAQKRQMKAFKNYLDNLRKEDKEYLIGFIEGLLISGEIKINLKRKEKKRK